MPSSKRIIDYGAYAEHTGPPYWVAVRSFIREWSLTGPYTSLPTIIYSWSRQPDPDFRSLTSAAILVLVVVILLVNGIAIIMRNRYARKW